MFHSTAQFYDKIYSFKNYREESDKIRALIENEHPNAQTVLDVACGTAEHAHFLRDRFKLDGIDLDPNFIEIARQKHPDGQFFVGNMKDFHLDRKYDVVMCLFSSIGYLKKPDEVVQALNAFKSHINHTGIIIIEPWLTPDVWKPGIPNMVTVNEPDLKICRMNVSEKIEGNLSRLRFEYLVATRDGVEHFKEDHDLALYSVSEMISFFTQAGLSVNHDPVGIFGRGIYIGRLQNA